MLCVPGQGEIREDIRIPEDQKGAERGPNGRRTSYGALYMTMASEKKLTAFRLNEEDRAIIEQLQKRTGVESAAAVVRFALREAIAGRPTTQKTHRRSIDVGPGMTQVSTARYWLDGHHFRNEDEALGAFRLAYQQGMDGMGASVREWMGLSAEEYDAWMRNNAVPKPRRRR